MNPFATGSGINKGFLEALGLAALVLVLGFSWPASHARAEQGKTPDAGAPGPGPAAAAVDADTLLALLDDWQIQIKDLSVAFEQVYTHPLAKEPRRASGVIDLKRPSLVRMEVTRPERRLLLLNDEGAVVYEPAQKQVFMGHVARIQELSFFTFLAEGRALRPLFSPRLLASARSADGATTRHVLELVPQGAVSSFSRLVLTVSVDPIRIDRVVVVEPSGGLNAFTLTRLRTNIGLTPDRFRFTKPPGVRLIPLSAPAK